MKRRSGSFKFPHYEAPRIVKQPDYAKWQAVSVGMSRKEVVGLLGRPLRDPYLVPTMRTDGPYCSYGYLQLPMMPHVRTYRFLIGFDGNDRVWSKVDPFGGVFSPDGTPSKPLIFTPNEGARFSHYPRIVDLRWYPVSGRYPMLYDMEVEYGELDGASFAKLMDETEIPFPYHVINFGGSQPGRFRVRGHNALGPGEWSEYRTFDFTDENQRRLFDEFKRQRGGECS